MITIPTPKHEDRGLFGWIEFADKQQTWEQAVVILAELAGCTLDEAGNVLDSKQGVQIARKFNNSSHPNLRAEIEAWYQQFGSKIDFADWYTY